MLKLKGYLEKEKEVMYTEKEFKELMKEIDKIQDERNQKILKSIVLEIAGKNAKKDSELKNISNSWYTLHEKEIIRYVTNILLNVGIPVSLSGYYYIREAILMTMLDVDRLQKITTRIYPDVAKIYKTTATRVERSIRHAIEVSWSRGNLEILNDIFGYSIENMKGRPTNSEFIAIISDKIRLEFDM